MKKVAASLVAVLIAATPALGFAASLGINTNATTSVTSGKSTSTTTNVGATTSATTGTGGSSSTSTGTTINGTFSDKSSFADVMGSLSNAKVASVDFTVLHPKHVRFVLVSKLSGYTAAGLKISKANLKNMVALDARIAADARLTASLKKAGYLPSNVVAVSTDTKGDLTLFIAK